MIYLDYNASVPMRPIAKAAFLSALEHVGNPSSPHFLGRKLRAQIDEARQEILKEMGGQRLVFTSGGTEANSMALYGMGDIPVLVSSTEHSSILKAVPHLQTLPVTKDGLIDLSVLEEALASHASPGLLSLMLVNNETGVIQPVQEAARLAKKKGWKVHTDASQALGHIPFSFEELGVDMMTLSSHKCGGPVGIGALILREDLHLAPLTRGSGQEYGMRSGTLSTPLILGFFTALQDARQNQEVSYNHLYQLQNQIEKALTRATVYGRQSPRAPHVLCLGMAGVPSHLQLIALDLKGIAVGAGAACSSGAMKGSHVLAAMGVETNDAQCAIRVSMGWNTQPPEIDAFIEAWKAIYNTHTGKETI